MPFKHKQPVFSKHKRVVCGIFALVLLQIPPPPKNEGCLKILAEGWVRGAARSWKLELPRGCLHGLKHFFPSILFFFTLQTEAVVVRITQKVNKRERSVRKSWALILKWGKQLSFWRLCEGRPCQQPERRRPCFVERETEETYTTFWESVSSPPVHPVSHLHTLTHRQCGGVCATVWSRAELLLPLTLIQRWHIRTIRPRTCWAQSVSGWGRGWAGEASCITSPEGLCYCFHLISTSCMVGGHDGVTFFTVVEKSLFWTLKFYSLYYFLIIVKRLPDILFFVCVWFKRFGCIRDDKDDLLELINGKIVKGLPFTLSHTHSYTSGCMRKLHSCSLCTVGRWMCCKEHRPAETSSSELARTVKVGQCWWPH